MTINELMTEMADRFGIAGEIAPDKDGVYRLGADGVTVAFMEVLEMNAALVFGEVCELPVEGRERFLTALLRENFMGRGAPGGAFSLSERDKVYLHRYVDLPSAETGAFCSALEDFVATLVNWRNLAKDYGPVAAECAAKAAADADAAQGFLCI